MHVVENPCFVLRRNALGDRDDEFDTRARRSLENAIGSERGRYEDHRGVGAVVPVTETVEPALGPGEPLDNESCRAVDVDGHLAGLPAVGRRQLETHLLPRRGRWPEGPQTRFLP